MVRGSGYVAAAALAVSGVCVSAFSPSSPSTSAIIRPRIATPTPTKPLHASFPQAQRTAALNLSSEAEELVKSKKSKDAEDTTASSAMQLETLQGGAVEENLNGVLVRLFIHASGCPCKISLCAPPSIVWLSALDVSILIIPLPIATRENKTKTRGQS